MIRLNITAEGQTEEGFVREVLSSHLLRFDVLCHVRSVMTSRKLRKRGGISKYLKARTDIVQWLKEQPGRDVRFSTMFDFYALPNDFPGVTESKRLNDPYGKVKCIEGALLDDIADDRLIPYIQLHEFEALVLSKPEEFALEFMDREKEIQDLEKCLKDFDGNPEMINDKPETAPSKRIKKLIPEYKKTTSGPQITELIGIDHLKATCRHFREWVEKLEALTP
jgi:hypothetical protein